jgi:hypothetical protein
MVASVVATGAVLGGVNLSLNAFVLARPLSQTYLGERTPQETYLSDRISQFGGRITVNCVPLIDMNPDLATSKRIVVARTAGALLFLSGTSPTMHKVLPIITMNQIDCDKAEGALRDTEKHKYSSSIKAYDVLGNFSHEYEHKTSNEANEAITECYATQNLQPRLEKLGYPHAIAARIGKACANINRPPDYISTDCRPGGSLDLHVSQNYPRLPVPIG